MKQRFTIGVTLLLLIGVPAFLLVFQKPSEEMIQLLAVEEELSWPEPLNRSIYDRGCHNDGWNALQYDRRVHYSYAEGTAVSELIDRLQHSTGWQQVETDTLDEWERFVKNTGNACVAIKTDDDSGYTIRGSNVVYTIILDDCLDREICRR